ncbi:hypothetical protein JYP51_03060 [Ponticoccus gilvus]|nr:hypothetical protein [Enemella evansiae]
MARTRNAEAGFRGMRRSSARPAAPPDPKARLFQTPPGAMLCFMNHGPMEARSGLIVQADPTQAKGNAARRAATDMLHRPAPGSARRPTLAADRGQDSADFVADLHQAVALPRLAGKARQ